MSTINNPHDKLFKGYMGDPENAKGFAKHNFPGEILEILDLDTLHPEKDTFISGALKEMYSDHLFEIFLMVQDFVYITDPEENQQMLREIFTRVHMIQTIDRFKKHLEMFFNYMVHAKDNLQVEEFLKTLESI